MKTVIQLRARTSCVHGPLPAQLGDRPWAGSASRGVVETGIDAPGKAWADRPLDELTAADPGLAAALDVDVRLLEIPHVGKQ